MNHSPGWNQPAGFFPSAYGWSGYDPRLDCVTVTWGDLVFRTSGREAFSPGRDVSIERGAFGGWWEPAMDATETTRHWTGDGVFSGLLRRSARTVEIGGLVKASSFDELLAVKAFMGRQRVAKLVVAEKSVTTEAIVRLISLRWSDLVDTPKMSRYSLTLLADDPLRYSGSQILTNGSNVLVNRGDSDAFPVLELTGPHGAITITHPGGVFTFPALSSGHRLIDCRNGDVWNGNTRTFPAIGGPWPFVPSGGASWTISGLGAGSALLKRFEAWS